MRIVVPLHKKGAYDVCDNFRGIALLSVPGKVFCRVIQNRLKEKANRALRENQCGFRKGRGCTDHLFSLRILMEKAREFHSPLYMCFVDLKKAYDSVNRKALWSVLQKRYHFPTKVVRILEALSPRNYRCCTSLWEGVWGISNCQRSPTRRRTRSNIIQPVP